MAGKHRVAVRDRASAREVARVLLVEDDLTARLTLQAVLQESGFSVDSAASAQEAMDKLEKDQYALVLCGLRSEGQANGEDECRRVINHARAQDYRPATAHLWASGSQSKVPKSGRLLIEPQELPALLTN